MKWIVIFIFILIVEFWFRHKKRKKINRCWFTSFDFVVGEYDQNEALPPLKCVLRRKKIIDNVVRKSIFVFCPNGSNFQACPFYFLSCNFKKERSYCKLEVWTAKMHCIDVCIWVLPSTAAFYRIIIMGKYMKIRSH